MGREGIGVRYHFRDIFPSNPQTCGKLLKRYTKIEANKRFILPLPILNRLSENCICLEFGVSLLFVYKFLYFFSVKKSFKLMIAHKTMLAKYFTKSIASEL